MTPAPPSSTKQPVAAPLKLDRLRAQWPLLLCLAFFVAGMAVTAAAHWRRGAVLMGAGLGLAGVLRLFLPPRLAGLLVVRRRWFDVLVGIVGHHHVRPGHPRAAPRTLSGPGPRQADSHCPWGTHVPGAAGVPGGMAADQR